MSPRSVILLYGQWSIAALSILPLLIVNVDCVDIFGAVMFLWFSLTLTFEAHSSLDGSTLAAVNLIIPVDVVVVAVTIVDGTVRVLITWGRQLAIIVVLKKVGLTSVVLIVANVTPITDWIHVNRIQLKCTGVFNFPELDDQTVSRNMQFTIILLKINKEKTIISRSK